MGYSYATSWKNRSAYRFSKEITIYLSPEAAGYGHGFRLYNVLLLQLVEKGNRTVIAGITLPNQPSVALHEKIGMQKVAHFEKVGFKFNKWLDVGYWQKDLATHKSWQPPKPN